MAEFIGISRAVAADGAIERKVADQCAIDWPAVRRRIVANGCGVARGSATALASAANLMACVFSIPRPTRRKQESATQEHSQEWLCHAGYLRTKTGPWSLNGI